MRTGGSTRRRRAAILASLLALTVGGVTARPSAEAAPGEPTMGPLISGTTAILERTHVWTDYAYDDRGTSPASAPTYPAQAQRGNAADLIQLQLRPSADGLSIRAVLETVLDPAVPSVGVGLDLDGKPGTGAPQLPGGGWIVAGTPLGLERLVVITHDGAKVMAWDGQGWTNGSTQSAHVDALTNTLDTVVPWDQLPERSPTWRVVGVVGLALPDASWLDGSGPIYDLAYVRDTSTSNFQSNVQAAVLAGKEDAAAAVATVVPADVASQTVLPQPVAGIKNTFLYRSALDLGEGVDTSSMTSNRAYAGPYQPYVAWFPADLPAHPPDGAVPARRDDDASQRLLRRRRILRSRLPVRSGRHRAASAPGDAPRARGGTARRGRPGGTGRPRRDRGRISALRRRS